MSRPRVPGTGGRAAERAASGEPLLGQLIRDVHWALRAALDEALAPHGLTLRQVGVLMALKRSPGLSNAELARGAFMTPQSMVELLSSMEGAGLVVRRPHPGGGRVLQAELTPAGTAALAACRSTMRETEDRLLADLSVGEQRELRALLARWLQSLRGYVPAGARARRVRGASGPSSRSV